VTTSGNPDLAIAKSHTGDFTQGDTAATYSVTVTNIGTAASSGAVVVTEAPPAGLAITAMSGSGWIVDLGSATCTRSDVLAAGAGYPAITVTVSVDTNAAAGVTNTVTVAGGGDVSPANNTASDPTSIAALTAFQSWQIQYFGTTANPSAATDADPDGDGMSNQAEFLAGTDPTNSASTFCITGVGPSGNDLLVTWSMGPGKTNALQAGTDDASGGYTNDFTDIFTVTNTVGTVTNYLDLGATTNFPSRFYRVRLVP
jgi:uncharacterized repeat protein (TIGR01451 family)